MQDNNVEVINLNNSDNDAITFKFADQEGPLDLLLFLIKKSKLSIEEVKLADITDQFIEAINSCDKLNLEQTSEFIVVASELIEIKSKSLLPRKEEEEDEELDPDFLLKIRLKEHELMKEMVEKLKPLENVDRFYKEPDEDAHKPRIVLKDMPLDMLLNAFVDMMHKVKIKEVTNEVKEIEKEKFTVEEKISTIKDTLLLHDEIAFSKLFTTESSKQEIVTTFMAILELLKLQEISIKQEDNFKDIILSNKEKY